jgi:hypothetical protein
MPIWNRSVVFCALGLAALILVPSSAAAQVRVGVFVGAPIVAAPVVVAPRVVAPAVPVAPYYPYAAYAYSPYYYPYAYGYPYYGGFGFSVGFGGYRYARPYGYRGGAYRGAVVRRHR